jgi:uncharacterized protein (TIGR00369 family)
MEDSPFLETIGVRLTGVHADGITIECGVAENLRNVFGGLHGGVTATVADAAGAFAIHRHFGEFRRIATVDLNVHYFRPVMDGRLFARARLLRAGTTLCVCAVDLTNKKTSVATALVTYMLLPAR